VYKLEGTIDVGQPCCEGRSEPSARLTNHSKGKLALFDDPSPERAAVPHFG